LLRALATSARVHAGALPAAGLTTAAANASSERQVREAWRTLGVVDAVVIHPSLSTPPGSRNPGLSAWKRGINASLRATFLLGRAAGAALERQGGGSLIVVIEPSDPDDAIAAVASDGLSCLVDGLGKALGAGVRVGEIAVGSRRTSMAAVARGVMQAVAAAAREPLPNVRSGAGSRG
jgi:hypothetical protein